MESSFIVKPRIGVTSSFRRDPVAVRPAADTEIDPASAVSATGDGGHPQHGPPQDARQDARQDPHHDHVPHDVVADPESREVINRENDVRTLASGREHPDQALLRQRAYRPARSDTEPAAVPESHANIKA